MLRLLPKIQLLSKPLTQEKTLTASKKTGEDNQVIWAISAMMAKTLRLATIGQQVSDITLQHFCQEVQDIEESLQRLPLEENKLLQFLLRDWMMHVFLQTDCVQLVQMQNILRSGDITGVAAGRRRTVQKIQKNDRSYPSAAACLGLILRVSPDYDVHTMPKSNQCPHNPIDNQQHESWIFLGIILAVACAGLSFL